jgi:hypothetical protein
MLCLLGAFALWRVWSIGGRIWSYGAYMNASPKDHRYDAAGCAAVAAAFVGFVAIVNVIHRAAEVVFFSILLLPAASLAVITFLWIRSDPAAGSAGMNEGADGVRSTAGLKLADLPGVACGTAIGLLGVYYLVPLPRSGWGVCEWTVFYPLFPDLWPIERGEIFDACSESAWTLSIIGSVLSLACLFAGAVAAVIGRNANSDRGAWAAAIVVAFVLARLALQVSVTADAPYVGWTESLMAGALIVWGAAWLGHAGGRRGVGWSRRWFGRTSPDNGVERVRT